MRRRREIIICFEHWPCRGSECLPPSKPWKRRRRFPCTWGWRDPGSGAGTWCAHLGPWWQSWRLQRGHQPDQSASSWASGLGRSAACSVQGRSRRSRWRTSGWLQWGEQPCPCTGQRIPPSEWSGRHSRWCPVNRRKKRKKKERKSWRDLCQRERAKVWVPCTCPRSAAWPWWCQGGVPRGRGRHLQSLQRRSPFCGKKARERD